ncbi:MAG: hypothetical protein ABI346_06390 [Candidatus Baltobacteraceae bacterium]
MSTFRSIFGSAAAIALLSACSGAGSQAAPLARIPSNVARSAGVASGAINWSYSVLPKAYQNTEGLRPADHPVESLPPPSPPLPQKLAYVSDFPANIVNVYNQITGAHLYTLGGLNNPQGLFVDHLRKLWVANTGANNILVFPRGATSPIYLLNDPYGPPVDVTVCAGGTVYVSNLYDFQTGIGDISVYAPGNLNPTGTLTYPGESSNAFLTCTPSGDVYSTMTDTGNVGRVVKYPGGNQAGATQLPIALSSSPGGIKPDNAGNLVVNDQLAHTVREYTTAGTPTGNSFGTGSGDWVDIAITQNGQVVLGADAVQQVGRRRSLWTGLLVSPPYTSTLFIRPAGTAFDRGQNGLG